MLYETLAVILATNTSKRIPDKPLVDINGRPGLSYIVDVLQHACVCTDIIVSTDDAMIAEVSQTYDISAVVMRDEDWNQKPLAEITALSAERYIQETGNQYDFYLEMYCTAIFWRPSWIRSALAMMHNGLLQKKPINAIFAHVEGCRVYRHGFLQNPRPALIMKHLGLNLGIEWYEDLYLARDIMKNIKNGNLEYPLIESVHTSADIELNRLKENCGLSLKEPFNFDKDNV